MCTPHAASQGQSATPAVKTLFTNLETFVTSFLLYLVIKIEGGLLPFFLKKKYFPVATFVCFASFFNTVRSGRQRIL